LIIVVYEICSKHPHEHTHQGLVNASKVRCVSTHGEHNT